jgi:hypothetical protein
MLLPKKMNRNDKDISATRLPPQKPGFSFSIRDPGLHQAGRNGNIKPSLSIK